MIALSTYDQVDEHGFRIRMLDSSGRHRSDDRAINIDDRFFKDSKGKKTRKSTTKG